MWIVRDMLQCASFVFYLQSSILVPVHVLVHVSEWIRFEWWFIGCHLPGQSSLDRP